MLYNKLINKFIILLTLFLLTSCNGGGGGSGSTQNFTIGGDVAGLNNNTSVVLADNGGNLTTVSKNGNFAFSQTITKDSNYKVTVATQPTGETCTVVDGNGYNIVSNVSNVQVICSEKTYSIGGVIEKLSPGSSVVLYNKTNDSSITVKQNGNSPTNFTFNAPVSYGSGYSVIVTSQPIGEICAVINHKNTIPVKLNITNILVTCSAKNYTISGNIYGLLPNEQVTLLNNDANPLKKNGSIVGTIPFTFTNIPSGSTYNITIPKSMQPVNEKCSVSGNSKLPVNSDISGIVVTCSKDLYSITANIAGNNIDSAEHIDTTNNGVQPSSWGVNGPLSPIFSDIPYKSSYDIVSNINGYSCNNVKGSNLSSSISININCTQQYFDLHQFMDGVHPEGGMIFDPSTGYFYGTTYEGGNSINNNNGIIYSLNPATGAESMVYVFNPSYYHNDGVNPSGKLVLAQDGNIYGTTQSGGQPQVTGRSNQGTIFRFNPMTNQESVVYTFTGLSDGCSPMDGLIQGSDGYLYGTASGCGDKGLNVNYGTVFKVDTNGQNFKVLHSFSGINDGDTPMSGVIEGSDGKIYGTTQLGSSNSSQAESGYGTIFSVNKDGTGYMILHSFNGSTDGAYPVNSLIEYSSGTFYGVVYYTGSNSVNPPNGIGNGVIYKYNNSSGYRTVYTFKNGDDGNNPSGSLLKGIDGNLYGVTATGGYSAGTLYVFNPNTLQENVLYGFNTEIAHPLGNLSQHTDGYIFGVTRNGGIGNGNAFKYKPL